MKRILAALAALFFCSIAASGQQSDLVFPRYPTHPGYLTGSFYSTFPGLSTTATAVPAIDTLYIYPFVVRANVTVVSLSIRVVTGGTGSSVKLALYANGTTGKPTGAPIAVNNTGGATTTSSGTVTLTVTSLPLSPGVYWVAQKHTGTLPTPVSISSASFNHNDIFGRSSIVSSSLTAWSRADTYSNNMPTLTGADSWTDVNSAGVAIVFLGT